jgi:hypothetical protein
MGRGPPVSKEGWCWDYRGKKNIEFEKYTAELVEHDDIKQNLLGQTRSG